MKQHSHKLALQGGPKAVVRMTGKPQPKIGVEEFLSLANRFGFSAAAMKKLRKSLTNKDLAPNGPHLGRYYGSANPSAGEQFEALARKVFRTEHALAISSGTGALHAAFVGVGVGPGTEVVCPGLGFAATAMAVTLAGGVPVFCDVDESLHMDPSKIEASITPRTVALAPTHHWGNVANMAPIMRIARRRGLKVVEDCAQSPGAKYRGQYVGTIGDAGCFSISSYKIIGGGEGGMVVARDQRIFERICQLAEGGGLWRNPRFGAPRYKGELFPGTNYRLSELESAVNVVQLGKLNDYVRRYRRASVRIRRQLGNYAEIRPQIINDRAGFIGYAIRFFPATFDLSRTVVEALRAEGISASTRGEKHGPDWHMYRDMFPVVLRTGHIRGGSVFEDPRYTRRGGKATYQAGQCPVAEDLFAREVSIGVDQWYSDTDCDNIASGINKVLAALCTPTPGKNRWM